ncbi:MAG: hypothetical protein EU533_05695 [Promethearchaeota archaeon]|nr:MAG: hypothetical protein EU533_05695 [Candidatus Lokiarchaeota archaeon]
MPQGFVITKWTHDQGMLVEMSYPEEIEVDLDDMMRVFYAHVVGAGSGGDVLVRLEKAHSNVSSHFTGMDAKVPYLVNLMLELGEDPDMFGEAIIKEINNNIVKYLNQLGIDINKDFETKRTLKEYLKNALFLLDRLKNMTKEQRLAQIYSSKKTRTILEILHERAYSRRELQNILEEKLGTFVSSIEYTLDPFIKTNLVKQDWIEGFTDIFLFLISDFTIFRKPAENLIESTKKNLPSPELAKDYRDAVSKFFSNYQPTLVDNVNIALNLLNPDKYDFIVLLRERPYPLNKLPKSPSDSFLDTRALLESLEKDQIVKILKDKRDIEWVFLFTDISTDTFFPEYILENIRTAPLKKEINVRHLELLEDVYQK